jgi:Flp pilus assembly protein TadB
MGKSSDIEMELKGGHGKAVIEGRTAVPFKTFVQLVLQRKVTALFKDQGNEPVVVASDLLTNLASAQQDSTENRTHLVLVTLGVGILVGVFVLATSQIALAALGVPLGLMELLVIACTIFGVGLLTSVLSRVQRKNRTAEKLADSMEKVAGMLAK